MAVASGEDPDERPSVWLLLNLDQAYEWQRSHYTEEDPTSFALLEQIAASVWINPAVELQYTESGPRLQWVWP